MGLTSNEILTQLKTQLDNELTYPIFLGIREELTQFPCIIIEPIGIAEGVDGEAVYNRVDATLTVGIYGYVRVHNKDKQIIGDSNTKGVVDVARDIKLAIDSDRTLSGKAIHTTIIDTVFSIVDYPFREVQVNLEILYRQTKGVR